MAETEGERDRMNIVGLVFFTVMSSFFWFISGALTTEDRDGSDFPLEVVTAVVATICTIVLVLVGMQIISYHG